MRALWHAPVLDTLENVELTLLIGSYAQAYHLGKKLQKNMTETVRVARLPARNPPTRIPAGGPMAGRKRTAGSTTNCCLNYADAFTA